MELRLNGIWPQTALRPASKLDSVMEFGFSSTKTIRVILCYVKPAFKDPVQLGGWAWTHAGIHLGKRL